MPSLLLWMERDAPACMLDELCSSVAWPRKDSAVPQVGGVQ